MRLSSDRSPQEKADPAPTGDWPQWWKRTAWGAGVMTVVAEGIIVLALAGSPTRQPTWMIGVALLTVPALLVLLLLPLRAARRRELRHEQGDCSVCGYSLTGNISGVCPECGSSFDPAVITRK